MFTKKFEEQDPAGVGTFTVPWSAIKVSLEEKFITSYQTLEKIEVSKEGIILHVGRKNKGE